MSALTTKELFQLAYAAGFRGDNLKMAVAIALAESGGNPAAYNPELAAGTKPGGGSRGLWQIYGTAHPQYNSSMAFDPSTNARAAFEVYQQAGGRFTPWSTFNNGMAASIYNSLQVPSGISNGGLKTIKKTTTNKSKSNTLGGGVVSGGGLSGGVSQTQTTQANALKAIASGEWLTNAGKKFDKVSFSFYVAGIILILIGLFVMFKEPAARLVVAGTKIAAASQGVPL